MSADNRKPVFVVGCFDRLLAREMRFLHEAAAAGPVQVQLWSDAVTEKLTGKKPKFPTVERLYVLEALRYVDQVVVCDSVDAAQRTPMLGASDSFPEGAIWMVDQAADDPQNQAFCTKHGLEYRVVSDELLGTLPEAPVEARPAEGKKVMVTGCYDWFHSGHVRFFEEVSELGSLYVVVGHDENIRLLKGDGHPMFPAVQRRFIAGAVKHVHQALVSSGDGWLDAEPEIKRIQPDMYAVNEDGDRPEKRDYCEAHGIEYRVLKRTPKEGLTKRQSTDLRGF